MPSLQGGAFSSPQEKVVGGTTLCWADLRWCCPCVISPGVFFRVLHRPRGFGEGEEDTQHPTAPRLATGAGRPTDPQLLAPTGVGASGLSTSRAKLYGINAPDFTFGAAPTTGAKTLRDLHSILHLRGPPHRPLGPAWPRRTIQDKQHDAAGLTDRPDVSSSG